MDASFGIGVESAYGTVATAFEGYESKSDSWKSDRQFIESVGFRAGMQTVRANRRNIVNMGGEGEIELDLLDAGAGTLLAAAFDTVTVTPDGAGMRTHVFKTSDVVESPSFTAQMVRPTTDGGRVAFRYGGCMVTGWTLTAETESAIVFNAACDFQDETYASTGIVDPVYPEDGFPLDWSRASVSLTRGGVAAPMNARKLEVTAERGLNTSRRFLRGNALKAVPLRAATPTYEGTLEGEFTSSGLPLYAAFVSGEVCGLTAVFAGLTPGSSLTVALPAIQFTGESPEASLDDLTVQNFPFRILEPESADAITATYVEPDPDFVGP